MKEVTFHIEGMTDASDAEKVKGAVNEVWGIRKAGVSDDLNKLTISYNEEAGSLVDFTQAIRACGYEPIQE
ncbi:cation transporter [Halobacillus massiliensis]|uniref:cation transporter n=1 Tax=Halobacillus massiliensis TaxID=1926286 RepID=UPI0009E24466|nr:heavy-metal-associated domain-containing protein [Halobacillus massiliensis]